MPGSDILKKQLESTRFEHALNYVLNSARGIKKLNTSELAHLNQMITHSPDDPWRTEPVKIRIPSGRERHFNIISNPMLKARDILGNAHDVLNRGEIANSAAYLYSKLVSEHFFKDGNRRTAVVATYWLLLEKNYEIDAHALHSIGLGDIHDPSDQQKLLADIASLLKK